MRFSFLLCIGRCKRLGLLESFLSYTSRYLGPILLSLLFTYLFLVYHKRWLMLWMATSHIPQLQRACLPGRKQSMSSKQQAFFFFTWAQKFAFVKGLFTGRVQSRQHFISHYLELFTLWRASWAHIIKSLPVIWETQSSTPGSGRSPGEGNGNPLQYSCLENPMDGGAWRATGHGVADSWT